MSKTAVKKPEKTVAVKTPSFVAANAEVIGLVALALLLIVVASIRSKFAGIPFERDEGIYGYIGNLVLEGKTPYVDFYEQKFPGLFYFYGLMVYLSGDTVKGLHTGFMVLNMLTIVVIYATSRKLFNPFAAIVSAITFAFVSLTANLSGFTVQSEHGVAFFISLGLFFYACQRDTGRRIYTALMGLAFGLAFMTKTSGLFLLVWGGGVFVIDYIFSKQRSFRTFIVDELFYCCSALLVAAIFILIVYAKGGMEQMIYWAYENPKYYVGKIPFEEGVKYFKYMRDAIVEHHKFFWIHGVLAAAVCFLKTFSIRQKFAILTLLALSFLTIVPGFYFYGHYWIQLIPALSIGAGVTFYGITTFLQERFRLTPGKAQTIYVVAFILITANHVISMKSYYFHPNYDLILRSVYGNNPFPESWKVAEFINANAKPEDKIAVIGSEPEIYFYTKKRAPSRHAYFSTVVNDVPQHREWQREYARDLEKAAPKYLIFFNHPISLFVQPNTDKYIFEFLNKYIADNYQLIGLADMPDGRQTTYVWREQLSGYQPQGNNTILVYERKPGK